MIPPTRRYPNYMYLTALPTLSFIGHIILAQPSSAFAPLRNNHAVRGNRSPTTRKFNPSLTLASNGPLGKIGDIFEEASASVIDYLLMQPKRDVPDGLRRVRTQFIAALGDPSASSGTGAESWGIWRIDPGPRGVYLTQFDAIAKGGGRAPAGWTWDPDEFWIEEYGRIMEKPEFPVSPGRYLVTGGRKVTTILTIDPPDQSGKQRWKLDDGARLYDVTHLPCRSAKYVPSRNEGALASPADANLAEYPVAPGAEMPPISGCNKQDYAVLFVLAVERDS